MERILKKIEALRSPDDCEHLQANYRDSFTQELTEYDAKLHGTEVIERILVAVVRSGHRNLMEIFAYPILQNAKLIDWRRKGALLDELVDSIKSCVQHRLAPDGHEKAYMGFLASLISVLNGSRSEAYVGKLFELVLLSLSTFEPSPIHDAAWRVLSSLEGKLLNHADVKAKLVIAAVNFVKANPTLTHESRDAFYNCSHILKETYPLFLDRLPELDEQDAPDVVNVDTIADSSELYLYILPYMTELFKICCAKVIQMPHDGDCLCRSLLEYMIFSQRKRPAVKVAVRKPIVDDIFQLSLCEDEKFSEAAAGLILDMVKQDISLVESHADAVVDLFVSGRERQLAKHMYNLTLIAPHQVAAKFDQVFRKMASAEETRYSLLLLTAQLSKTDPLVVKPAHASYLTQSIASSPHNERLVAFWNDLAQFNPHALLDCEHDILQFVRSSPSNASALQVYLAKAVTKTSSVSAFLQLFAELAIALDESREVHDILKLMRLIGKSHPTELATHREVIESLKKHEEHQRVCEQLIDIIELRDKSSVSNQEESRAAQTGVMKTTKDKVGALLNNAQRTDRSVTRRRVSFRLERNESVETKAENHGRLDKRTVSNNPVWFSAVSELLNEADGDDWKSLALRLGYSVEDIRKCASMQNPCLSLLENWFSKNKTRQATYAVYRVLLELDQRDAAAIIEEALTSSHVDLDDEEKEFIEPQPIFLSYQWAHQQQVKLLKRHLAMAGYAAWMDIGQISGGGKFFAEIDVMRTAKVVVCCVTDRYLQSTNCCREVAIAVNSGKPVIPILMERMNWPPPGAMGHLFSRQSHMHIQFCHSSANAALDSETFWNKDRFGELLMLLRYYQSPDTRIIQSDSPYKDWWLPSQDLSYRSTKTRRFQSSTSSLRSPIAEVNNDETACAVFISYQLDMQPHVKLLYRRLTQLGYTCWLDIMQMGGDDSLYDKIDRGIRSCRVVLSCVTTKYAFSANCRREVRLADALQKPIIPLLLEALRWPPEGPMESVFTQLLYIDFSKDLKQLTEHKCEKFDELVSKLERFVYARTLAYPAVNVSANTSRTSVSDRKASASTMKYGARQSNTAQNGLPGVQSSTQSAQKTKKVSSNFSTLPKP